jgi:hypothetical protein
MPGKLVIAYFSVKRQNVAVHAVALSPSYTLLGKLQRGLGSGFLEALRVEREHAHGLILSCLAEDPRRDPSEARGRYYGELCLETRIELAELAALVEAADDNPETRRLVLQTVGWLAWRGIAGPIAMLRDYVLGGGEDAVLAVSYLWHPRAFSGLDAPLLERYSSGIALAEAIADAGVEAGGEPWRSWSVSRHVVADAVSRVTDPLPAPRLAAEPRATGDALALLEELGAALERDECVCALARGIADGSGDPFALLERAFRSVSRSSCRVTIARELARTSSAVHTRAREWLWDAEPEVVVAGLAVCDLADGATAARAQALARDGWPVPAA